MSVSMGTHPNCRVLCIQSHVVSGYCGNKSAVFPLQSLGFDVDFINSVQFSTHTGYPKWTGQVLNEKDLLELFEGLKQNNLHVRYSHLLTGYTRSASFLRAVHSVIKEVKECSPGAIYLCDPVMGDNGKMYVPNDLLEVYRDLIIPMADIICPNQFEAELLTGIQIKDMSSALEAIQKLHSMGNIATVVISSTDQFEYWQQTENEKEGDYILTIGSSRLPGRKPELYVVRSARIAANFTGTGDLFAALFLAWFTKTDKNLEQTLLNVIGTMQAVIRRTFEYGQAMPGGLTEPVNRELQIIQSREDIIQPNLCLIHCEPIVHSSK